MISIVIPTWNEESTIFETLHQFTKCTNIEIVIADGQSNDTTQKEIIRFQSQYPQLKITFITCTNKGRGFQMNEGAKYTHGHIILFLHADTILPITWQSDITNAITQKKYIGGAFTTVFNNKKKIYRLLELYPRMRSRICKTYHGDQAMFITKKIYDDIGGMPNVRLMEDVLLSQKMKKTGKTILISSPAITSARRFEEFGLFKSILRYIYIKTLFFFTKDTEKVARLYK